MRDNDTNDESSFALLQELCRKDEVKVYILTALQKIAKLNKLRSFEVVRAVHLDPVEWEVGSELMTPSYKLVRNKLLTHYQH